MDLKEEKEVYIGFGEVKGKGKWCYNIKNKGNIEIKFKM